LIKLNNLFLILLTFKKIKNKLKKLMEIVKQMVVKVANSFFLHMIKNLF